MPTTIKQAIDGFLLSCKAEVPSISPVYHLPQITPGWSGSVDRAISAMLNYPVNQEGKKL
jgi:hypothetical protein